MFTALYKCWLTFNPKTKETQLVSKRPIMLQSHHFKSRYLDITIFDIFLHTWV